MSELFLEDGNARKGEPLETAGSVRAPEAREPRTGVQGSEESVTGSVRESAQDPPYPRPAGRSLLLQRLASKMRLMDRPQRFSTSG